MKIERRKTYWTEKTRIRIYKDERFEIWRPVGFEEALEKALKSSRAKGGKNGTRSKKRRYL